MKRFIFTKCLYGTAVLGLFVLFACSKQENLETLEQSQNNPSETSVTGDCSELGVDYAIVSAWANISKELRPACTFGIQYSTSSSFGSDWQYVKASTIDSDNNYSVKLTGLKYGTNYYYRSYVRYISNDLYEYGSTKSFKTKAMVPQFNKSEEPYVRVENYTNRTTLEFKYTNNGGAEITKALIYYSTSPFYWSGGYTVGKVPDVITQGLAKSVPAEDEGDCFSCHLEDLKETTQYYAICYLENSVGGDFSHWVSFKTGVTPPNSEDAVDMGLSILWASKNLGANKPQDSGYLFKWGETETCNRTSQYKFYNGSTYTKYNHNDGKTVLEPVDDAAHVMLGGKWRMPTIEELIELFENSEYMYIEYGLDKGIMIRSKVKGYENNSIFLPINGYYYYKGIAWGYDYHQKELGIWTSSLEEDGYLDMFSNGYTGWFFPITDDYSNFDTTNLYFGEKRENALGIRPVLER